MSDLAHYADLLATIKSRIQVAQSRAVLAVNSELIALYWQLGHTLHVRQAEAGCGAGVIPRLATDIRNELPEVKGFSERNLKRMLAFYRAYPDETAFAPQPVAQLTEDTGQIEGALSKGPQAEAQIGVAHLPAMCALPWGHHLLLLERMKDVGDRRWYVRQAVAEGWSRSLLTTQIAARAHVRQGALVSNFADPLPSPQSQLVRQSIKDPYLFDKLRALVVIELKRGDFKPEYAGKLNFYCNVVDDTLRHAQDAPTIGLMLCQTKDSVLAEYALRGIDKRIGIASYELTRALPETLQSVLPSIEALEAELSLIPQAAPHTDIQ